MSTTFAQLGVPTFVCDALARRDITEPFEIQAVTIADMLAGRDVCGRAPTGSGKTLAFGVPVIANTERAEPHRPRALILAPTRELAEQITSELRTFAGRLRVDAVYGGVGYGYQLKALRRGVDVLVACPGRLEDLIERGDVSLDHVQCVVLDEADRMADMGFMPAVRRLLDRTPAERQTVLFSATLDGDVAKLTRDYQRDPVRHAVGPETTDVRAATHVFWKVDRNDRNDVLAEVVKAAWPSVIFCRTRHGADRLVKQLGRLDVECVAIHGGLGQSQRNRALESFSNGRVHALVATDVAARGIHVDGVASVVHYDPPEDHKAYVHRSGRTARAGAAGVVVSLVQPEQMKSARRMQREVGIDEQIVVPDVAALPVDTLDPQRSLAAPAEVVTPRAPARSRAGRDSRPAQPAQRRDRNRDRSNDWSPQDKRGEQRSGRDDRPRLSGAPDGRAPRQNRAARRAHLQPGATRGAHGSHGSHGSQHSKNGRGPKKSGRRPA